MQITYLGDYYEIDKESYNKLKNFPRRLKTAARHLNPSKDSKSYTFYVYTYYESDELRWSSAYSSNKYYMSKFSDIYIHFSTKNLSITNCKYLTKLIDKEEDFREVIKIVKEEVQTSFKKS